MKKFAWILAVSLALCYQSVYAQEFTLASDDFSGQLTDTQVFSGFGCHGKNISPALRWSNAPADAKSFAVTVYDPDAPTGGGWWHWLIFNIPANTAMLKTNAGNLQQHLAPEGSVQSITSYGVPGFGGACPPIGDKPHRYVFTVYALDTAKLDLKPQTQPAMVGFALNQHAIAKASLIAYYGR